MKLVNRLIKNINFHSALLVAIFLLGLWLRLSNIDQLVWEQDGNDENRDMLVAEHIVSYGEKIKKGPLAAGGFNWLHNSPIYFYSVAVIWSVTKEPLLFMKFLAITMSVFPLIGYQIGKKILDKNLGLITALMFAINVELIHQSRQLLQPFFLPLFSALFLLSILKTRKKNNYFYLSLSIFFLLIQLHFHYGVLIILPAGAFIIFKYWYELIKKDFSFKNFFAPIFTIASLGIPWLLLTYRKFIFDQFGFFIINFGHEKQPFFSKLGAISFNILSMMFSSEQVRFSIPIFTLLLLSAVFIKNKKAHKANWIIFLLASSVLLMTLSNGNIANTYLVATLPFFLVLLSYGLYKIIKFNYFFGIILLTTIALRTFSINLYINKHSLPTTSYYKQKEQISRYIFNDYFQNNKNKPANFALATIDDMAPFDGWGTTGFWFHLEKMTNQKLVQLVDYGVNIDPLVVKADTIYLICEYRYPVSAQEVRDFTDFCLNKFTKVRNYLEPGKKRIFQSKRYSVWKFNINPKKIIPTYNHVYLSDLKK